MTEAALFPRRFRKIGWLLFIPGLLLGISSLIYEFEWTWFIFNIPSFGNDLLETSEQTKGQFRWMSENLSNELFGLLILVGSMFVALSRKQQEDEFHVHLRLSALVWAVYLNAVIQVIAILFLYGFEFLFFMQSNLFAVMILFILRYHLILRKYKLQGDAQ